VIFFYQYIFFCVETFPLFLSLVPLSLIVSKPKNIIHLTTHISSLYKYRSILCKNCPSLFYKIKQKVMIIQFKINSCDLLWENDIEKKIEIMYNSNAYLM